MNFKKYFFSRRAESGLLVGRMKTRDAAFAFRMGAGFAGDVNRTHPVSIEAMMLDATNPPTFFGQPVVLDATSHNPRKLLAGDTALTSIEGVIVRPFPTQQPQAATDFAPATFNSGGPSTKFAQDVLRWGYINVVLGNGQLTGAVRGGAVFIWCAASSGNHVQGGFETVASGGNTMSLDGRFTYRAVQDANGVVELCIR